MAGFHPWLFLLMSLLAVVQIGLTAFFIDHFNHHGWPPNGQFYSVMNLFMVTAVWTAITAFLYTFFLKVEHPHEIEHDVHTSPSGLGVWFLITLVLWIVPTVLFQTTFANGRCNNTVYWNCSKISAMTVVGWIEFALCVVTMVATLVWFVSARRVIRGPPVLVASPYPVAVPAQPMYHY